PHDIYIDDILFNDNPDSRDAISTFVSTDITEHIKVFPNPAHDKLFVSGFNGECIDVIDVSGKVYCSLTGLSGKKEIDLGLLPEGLYLLRLKYDDFHVIRKFLKK
ncbi:MAG: T9SS type A sorting domain-containing protein, partial [Bacteroidales bacterium]|nr:T9SS type A sorting domain-containing protein [Bacteroidales bacterium]